MSKDDVTPPGYFELLASMNSRTDNESLPLPANLYWVNPRVDLFEYGSTILTADEIFRLYEGGMRFPQVLLRRWEDAAENYIAEHNPEYAQGYEDEFAGSEYFDFNDIGTTTLDDLFNDYESGLDLQADRRENWENHPVAQLVRSNPNVEHLVPDFTNSLSYTLSALAVYKILKYRRHPKKAAYYVKAFS